MSTPDQTAPDVITAWNWARKTIFLLPALVDFGIVLLEKLWNNTATRRDLYGALHYFNTQRDYIRDQEKNIGFVDDLVVWTYVYSKLVPRHEQTVRGCLEKYTAWEDIECFLDATNADGVSFCEAHFSVLFPLINKWLVDNTQEIPQVMNDEELANLRDDCLWTKESIFDKAVEYELPPYEELRAREKEIFASFINAKL